MGAYDEGTEDPQSLGQTVRRHAPRYRGRGCVEHHGEGQSLDEAEELTRFFFGDELAARVVEKEWLILPECTGIWWLHV